MKIDSNFFINFFSNNNKDNKYSYPENSPIYSRKVRHIYLSRNFLKLVEKDEKNSNVE